MTMNNTSPSLISEHLTHPKYRADIDGLRAVAVLSVVGFHAFPNWVKGGFIGVDIFFVISGFLISTIIFSNLECNRFSYIEFYSRRIKRIFPALLLVLIASLVFGWFVLLSVEYKQLGKHIFGGAGFISNLVLWKESGYFDNAAETKPLLHLWSLAIEEQFYIFWPLLLGLVWKRKWSFLVITAAVAFISFIFNIYIINKNPTSAFFLPVPRFWELMIGGLLAYITLHKPSINRRYKNAQSILGFFILALGLIFINKIRVFPGWWSLLPTFGAALIISAGPNVWLNKNFLSNKLIVWFGLISYPLYLWHWPLLSFARIVESDDNLPEIRIAAVLLSTALAWFTYKLIEKPIRFGNHGKTKTITLLILMLAVGYSGFYSYIHDGLKFRKFAKETEIISAAINNTEYPRGLISKNTDGIVFHATREQSPKILFLGDSHIEQFSPRVVKLDNDNLTPPSIFLTSGGCPPIPNVFEDKHPNCKNYIDNFIKLSEQTDTLKTIVIGGCWYCYFIQQTQNPPANGDAYNYYFLAGNKKFYFREENGKERALSSLKDFLTTLSKKYTVFLLLDNPASVDFDPMEMIRGKRRAIESIGSLTKTITVPQNQIKLNDELRTIGSEAGVKIIDQISNLCPNKSCITKVSELK